MLRLRPWLLLWPWLWRRLLRLWPCRLLRLRANFRLRIASWFRSHSWLLCITTRFRTYGRLLSIAAWLRTSSWLLSVTTLFRTTSIILLYFLSEGRLSACIHLCCCLWLTYCSWCLHYIARACSAYCAPVYCRAIQAYCILPEGGCTRPVGLVDTIYLHRLVSYLLYSCCTRAIVIPYMCAIIFVYILYIVATAHVFPVVVRTSPVADAIVSVHILRAYEYPPAVGAAIAYAYTESRCKRSPSGIATAIAPANPCRCPFITRYPYPAVVRIVCPATVVVACPTPWVF